MTRKEQAMAYFKEGYNCSQAVFLTFCDITGYEKSEAAKLSAPFGGGFGRQREVCGAVSGMCLVIGHFFGSDDPADHEAKAKIYERTQEVCATFRERFGSIICRELLSRDEASSTTPTPSARTEAYYKKRPCAEIVGEAAEIVEAYLLAHGKL